MKQSRVWVRVLYKIYSLWDNKSSTQPCFQASCCFVTGDISNIFPTTSYKNFVNSTSQRVQY